MTDDRGAERGRRAGAGCARIRWRASRTEFHHPYDAAGRRLVYLCGHSLGLQPKSAAQYVEQELKDWRRLGVLGHHAAERPWIDYHEHAAAPLAALVGAREAEVVAMNSLTVNLHLMMVSFFRPDAQPQSHSHRKIGISLGSLRRGVAARFSRTERGRASDRDRAARPASER